VLWIRIFLEQMMSKFSLSMRVPGTLFVYLV